ncbi:MAG: hypothetical protein SVX43_04925, partial [Cyanobacteriota bacterium]|nr:hypothetical protein [Cyanobacteriota bacterium]
EARRRDRSSSIADVPLDEHQAEGRGQSPSQSDPPTEPRTSRQSPPSRGLQRTPTHSPQELEAYEARVERVRNVRMLKFKIKWMDALSDRARQQLQEIDPESLLEISPETVPDTEPLLSGEIDSNFPDRDLIAALEESYLETLSFFPGETALHGEESPYNNELEAL